MLGIRLISSIEFTSPTRILKTELFVDIMIKTWARSRELQTFHVKNTDRILF